MGFRISWLATQHPEDAVLTALELAPTGRSSDIPEFVSAALTLPGGWTVIWSQDEGFFSPSRCEDLSRAFPLIGVQVNETVMHSRVVSCRDGATAWTVWHEGDEIRGHIAASGSVPEAYPRLVDEARRWQAEDAEVDYLFEVPLQLAQAICGFKHDEFAGDSGAYRELAGVGASDRPGGWLRRLLGS